MFNSSEKRLARMLLLLAHFGKESRSEKVVPRVRQEDLAQMVGTTRSRVSHFMKKFRELGFIDYSDTGGLTVHSGLLSVVLNDASHIELGGLENSPPPGLAKRSKRSTLRPPGGRAPTAFSFSLATDECRADAGRI